jgi:hypothetical protein
MSKAKGRACTSKSFLEEEVSSLVEMAGKKIFLRLLQQNQKNVIGL